MLGTNTIVKKGVSVKEEIETEEDRYKE